MAKTSARDRVLSQASASMPLSLKFGKKRSHDFTQPDVVWKPFPSSPQEFAYHHPADVLFYGGASGSGKTDLLLGLAGTGHSRTLILRREFPRTRAIIERSREIYSRGTSDCSKDSYNESLHLWRLQDGRTIEIGSVQYEKDWIKYQGQAHDLKCVGAGTLVWMADGTRKPIESIKVGDRVRTLQGDRRVARLFQQAKPAALVTAFVDGVPCASQVQSCSHELLLDSRSWASRDTSFSACHPSFSFATRPRCDGKSSRSSKPTYELQPLTHAVQSLDLAQLLIPFQYPLDRQSWLGLPVDTAEAIQGSDCVLSCGEALAFLQLPLPSPFLLAPSSTHLYRSQSWSSQPVFCRDAVYAPAASSRQDLTGHCLSDLDHGGERLHLSEGVVLLCPHQLNDVELHSQNDSPVDDRDTIPTHSRHKWSYAHPYTKEIHQTDLAKRVSYEVEVCDLGVLPLFDITVEYCNHYITGNGFVNRNCYDEITEFTEKQFRSINIWNRNLDPDDVCRCRVVATGNPPTTVEGEWIIDYWAPFLDEEHPNPAAPGSLVWYARTKVDDEDKDLEIGRTSLDEVMDAIATKRAIPRPTYTLPNGKVLEGQSRTFVPGKVEDNPVLMAQGYDKQLDALPEDMRSRFREGKFSRVVESEELQIIPTPWVIAAMERWKRFMGTDALLPTKDAIAIYKQKVGNAVQDAIGCDPARGGMDETCIAPKYGDWYAPVLITPGKQTPEGKDVAMKLGEIREHNSLIKIDVIGIGSSPYDACNDVGWAVYALNGAEAAIDSEDKPVRDRSGLLTFANKRAMWVWQFMEALDPQHGSNIMIPPDPRIKTDLCSMRRASVEGRVIAVEKKSDIKKRIGRSPDRGESIIYASARSLTIRRNHAIAGKMVSSRDRLSW